MLTLQRRLDQSILIGEDIRVMVVEIRGGSVKLGVEAPKSMRIDRDEIRASKDYDASQFTGTDSGA